MKSITNKINQFDCWTYQSLITQQECDMNPFFDGLKSTGDYVKKQFKFDKNTDLVYISDTETVSIHDIPNIPEDGCKQVVLGTFELIDVYFYYNEMIANKFILLSAENWTENLNQMYISCAFKLLLDNQSCAYPIRILLPMDENMLLRTNKTTQKKAKCLKGQNEQNDQYRDGDRAPPITTCPQVSHASLCRWVAFERLDEYQQRHERDKTTRNAG